MKKLWIIANWKSHKMLPAALDWIGELGPKLEREENIKVVVCPTFTSLEEIKKVITVGNYPIMVGSQDLSPYEEGAYTGEEAASILKQYVDLSIIGHSERRRDFAEDDQEVAKKVAQALKHQIIPLVCVQNTETPVPKNCNLVAYEPIFAIGSGNPDTPENANLVAKEIKTKHQGEVEVLYGGSVTSENCKAFIEREDISGLLIGGASLEAEEFLKIVEICTTQAKNL